MPKPAKTDGIFISCVSDEFEKAGALFPGLRGQLRRYLARTRSNVRVQEDFPQAAVDTVKKLADEIRRLAVVIHLVGKMPGSVAKPAELPPSKTQEYSSASAPKVLPAHSRCKSDRLLVTGLA